MGNSFTASGDMAKALNKFKKNLQRLNYHFDEQRRTPTKNTMSVVLNGEKIASKAIFKHTIFLTLKASIKIFKTMELFVVLQ